MKRSYILMSATAAIIMAGMAGTAHADSIRLCTGSGDGVYFAAGEQIKQTAGSRLPIEVIETTGTQDNMERTIDYEASEEGSCDAMIGQPDGPAYLARSNPAKAKKLRQVASLHREYLHVLCSKESGVDDLGDLEGGKNGTLAIGEQGSGGWLLWQNLVAEDDGYSSVPLSNEGGILAISSVSSGMTACMLVPAGLGNGTVNEADISFGDTVRLVGANDKDFNDALGINGKPLYEYKDLPAGTYKSNLQAGFWGNSVSTITWTAGVYVNVDRFTDKKLLSSFIQAVSRASLGIKAEYGR